MFFLHDISQCFMKWCTPMSKINWLMFFLHHCPTASPGRSSEQPLCTQCAALPAKFLAALLPMPALASFFARSSLIIAHSSFVCSYRRCHDSLAFLFWQPGVLEVPGIQNSTEYVRNIAHFAAQAAASLPLLFADTMMIFSSLNLWQAARVLCCKGPCH